MRVFLIRFLIIAALLALWEGLPRIGLLNANFLPPLSIVTQNLWAMIVSGELAKHALISLQRIAEGLGVSILIGVPLGLVMGSFKSLESAIDGPLQAGRQVSAIALFPVFILFFGIGELSKVAIIFWASVWPILVSTIAGVKSIDPVLLRSARSMGAEGLTLFRKVILPAAAPSIFTGVRLGAAYAFMVLVAAEMIGANADLASWSSTRRKFFAFPICTPRWFRSRLSAFS